MYGNAAKLNVTRVEIATTKAVKNDQFEWTDNVIGSISNAWKIRIGIKSLVKSNDQLLLFADENTEESRGITYSFNI